MLKSVNNDLDVIHNGGYIMDGCCSRCQYHGRCHGTDNYALCIRCYTNIINSYWHNIINGPFLEVNCTSCRQRKYCNLDLVSGIAVCLSCQDKRNNEQNNLFHYYMEQTETTLERMRSNIY